MSNSSSRRRCSPAAYAKLKRLSATTPGTRSASCPRMPIYKDSLVPRSTPAGRFAPAYAQGVGGLADRRDLASPVLHLAYSHRLISPVALGEVEALVGEIDQRL